MAELNPNLPTADPPVDPAPAQPLSPGQKLVAATPPPEAPVADPTTAEPTISPRLQKLAEEFGFENLKDDGEALDRLTAYTQNLRNEFGSQLQAALSELKQPQPTAEPPAATQDAKTGKWTWAPPAVDPALIQQYRAPDGNWKDGTPDSVKGAVAARQAYLDGFVNKFVADPAAALDPLLEDKFNAYFEQKYGQLAAQQQAQTFQQQLVNDNPWLFDNDPVSGKPKLGDFSALSAEGKLIDQYMREAMTPDHSGSAMNYEQAWKYANALHRASKAEFAAKQTTQTLSAEQINAQKKAELLARAANGASRGGSQPQPAAPSQTQNKHLSFGERFRQNAERNGVPLNPVA